MDPVTVLLTKPVEWHGKMMSQLTVRAPSTRIYLKLGEPRLVIRNSDGAIYYVEKDDVIRQYIEDMVVCDDGPDFIGLLPFVDGKRVKGAVLGFFDKADAIIFDHKSALSSST